MSQDIDSVLSQVSKEIEPQDVEQARKENKKVDAAYGGDGRGLIVVTVSTPAKPDEIY